MDRKGVTPSPMEGSKGRPRDVRHKPLPLLLPEIVDSVLEIVVWREGRQSDTRSSSAHGNGMDQWELRLTGPCHP